MDQPVFDGQPYELPTLRVSGSAREMGRAHGEAYRQQIVAFVAQRLDAASEYMAERMPGVEFQQFLELGKECLGIAAKWDPEGTEEHEGIAEGAGVDSARLYTVANMTDIRDVLLLPPPGDDEGCTSFLLPPELTQGGQVLAGQTWDLNPQDLDYVLAVHRVPDEGPETWSVGCVGCLTLVGMNQYGVSVGTTNIKVRGSRPGIGYLSLLHRMIRAKTREEAGRIVETAPRSAAHTYWAADAGGALEYEVSAQDFVKRQAKLEPIARTNHCLAPQHVPLQGEPTNSSSKARLDRMGQILSKGAHDVDSLRRAFADRSDGVDSIARFPEDNQGTATNSCIITRPAAREIWACKGPSQRGAWRRLQFERD
ncbi:MAG: hypothetical protein KC766_40315 [Myxococcales bacterium]|nr:hypothetical protein [Myxococcales bacterium]